MMMVICWLYSVPRLGDLQNHRDHISLVGNYDINLVCRWKVYFLDVTTHQTCESLSILLNTNRLNLNAKLTETHMLISKLD
jgi:hypothetical protein